MIESRGYRPAPPRAVPGEDLRRLEIEIEEAPRSTVIEYRKAG